MVGSWWLVVGSWWLVAGLDCSPKRQRGDKSANLPFGPAAHPVPSGAKLMALNAPESNCFQVLPLSVETSDPEGPVVIHMPRLAR